MGRFTRARNAPAAAPSYAADGRIDAGGGFSTRPTACHVFFPDPRLGAHRIIGSRIDTRGKYPPGGWQANLGNRRGDAQKSVENHIRAAPDCAAMEVFRPVVSHGGFAKLRDWSYFRLRRGS
ncbi:hypothetical protein MPUL_32980 [Mycolicibacterium pulveris]|uniref:Uncharacterized protein n=1 Tax=Mycolicibacterium pulveris TaxID=36813 RepID=A0A7I7UMB5_MYCPV|nr:hypothetical protein MPUL_32980 [Mycolicibacterium pulveris]